MASVRARNSVTLLQDAREPDCDRLLTRVQMRRAVDLAAEEEALHAVLDTADHEHPPVQVERERSVKFSRGAQAASSSLRGF